MNVMLRYPEASGMLVGANLVSPWLSAGKNEGKHKVCPYEE